MKSESSQDRIPLLPQNAFFSQIASQSYDNNNQIKLGHWVNNGSKFMSANFDIKLDPKLQQITHVQSIYPSINGSFLIHVKHNQKSHQFIYYSSQGKVINQITFQDSSILSEMVTATDILIVGVSSKTTQFFINQWNIFQKSPISFYYEKLVINDQMPKQLIIFPHSNLFCLSFIQKQKQKLGGMIGKPKPEILHLMYFKFPLSLQTSQPILVTYYQIPKDLIYLDFKLSKLNNISMVGWIGSQLTCKENTQIIIHQIKNHQNSWNHYQFNNIFNENPTVCGVRVIDIWQIQNGFFYIRLSTEVDVVEKYPQSNLSQYTINVLEEIQTSHSLIWNYTQGKDNYRYTKFTIRIDHQLQILGNYRKQKSKIQIKPNLEQRHNSIFSNIEYLRVYKNLPVFYVDLPNQRIMAVHQGSTGNASIQNQSNIHYGYPMFDNELQFQYKLQSSSQINVQVTKIQWLRYPGSIITVFLITNYIQDGDEDLMREVVQLLNFLL